tara:strand:+ start:3523 stop:3813 length:291 start_codon:yes stop_codon:yes gene_type:complete
MKPNFKQRIEALQLVTKGKKEYDFTMTGIRIRLTWIDQRNTNLKVHDEGVIELIHKSKDKKDTNDQIWVDWDNGLDEMLLRSKCCYMFTNSDGQLV